MKLAITIATKNRRSELTRTCAALARLDPRPDELWICADGCVDDTADWVRENLPDARLIVHETSRHSIRSRDEMLRATKADIVVGLDDDSYPLDADFVARVKARFAEWPRCAVLSFPQRTDEFPSTLTQTDFGPLLRAGTYVNAASAMRRQTYLDLGGWPLEFEHMGDEPDYALRCLASGLEVIHDTTLTVRHHWSAQERNELSNHHRHARNECWSTLIRCPWPILPFSLARRAAGQFAYACRRGLRWAWREPVWWWLCLSGGGTMWRRREAVTIAAWRRWRRLLRTPENLA